MASSSTSNNKTIAIISSEDDSTTELLVISGNENGCDEKDQTIRIIPANELMQRLQETAGEMNYAYDTRRAAVKRQAMMTLSIIGRAVQTRIQLPTCEAKEILSKKLNGMIDGYVEILKRNEPRIDAKERLGSLEELEDACNILGQIQKAVSGYYILLETIKACPEELLTELGETIRKYESA